MTEVNEILTLIAAQIKADARELIEYAAQDEIGGYHWNAAESKWPQGSLFSVEGKILYALVRWLKPDVVAEIGGWSGASASHLATAVRDNGFGHVFSIDSEIGGMSHGSLLPKELQQYVTLVRANGQDWLAEQADGSLDFVFEDADHSASLVALLSGLALVKLSAGGLLLNHDAAHDFAYDGFGNAASSSAVGLEVRNGLSQAGAYFRVYRSEPSDCGLALTVKPGIRKSAEPDATKDAVVTARVIKADLGVLPEYMGNANIESASEPPPIAPEPVKPKRSHKAKAK